MFWFVLTPPPLNYKFKSCFDLMGTPVRQLEFGSCGYCTGSITGTCALPGTLVFCGFRFFLTAIFSLSRSSLSTKIHVMHMKWQLWTSSMFSLIKLDGPLCDCSPNVPFLSFLMKHGVKFFSLMARDVLDKVWGCWAWTSLAYWTLPPMDSLVHSNRDSKPCLFAGKFPSYFMHSRTTFDFLTQIITCIVSQAAVSAKHFPSEVYAGFGFYFFYRLFFHISNDKSEPRVTPWFLFSRVYYNIYSSL